MIMGSTAFDTEAKYVDNAHRWSDVRVVEGARLEIWCGARPHLGFESLSLRKGKRIRCKSGPLCFYLRDQVGFEAERQADAKR